MDGAGTNMGDQAINRLDQSVDQSLDSLSDVLCSLSRLSGASAERQACRRQLTEAMRAWPGDAKDNWWRWLMEAGRSLGVPLRVTDATLSDAVDFVAGGVPGYTDLGDHPSGGLLLCETRGARLRYATVADGLSQHWAKSDKYVRQIQKDLEPTVLRWVVVEQLTPPGAAFHVPPFRRLLRILRPEFSDIWVVVVLAVFVGLLAVATPLAGQQLVRTVTFGRLYQPIVVLSLMLLTFLAFMAILQALHIFVVELIQRRLFARTVADVSYRLPRADQTFLDHEYGPELVNRFFDIMTIQKVVAGLLVDGLAVVLTTLVGMTLLALYHPYLLGYDFMLLALMVVAVGVLGRGGSRTAIQESRAKYRVAAWLQEVGRTTMSFKLHGGSDFSVDRADRYTADYLAARQRHFRVMMRQILAILGLQAIASTTLLGLGGWLVMTDQLTLGQLVAAELVVAAIVGSFAKMIKHIEGYFDLVAAVDKVGHLLDIPIESQRGYMAFPSDQGCAVHSHDLTISLHHGGHDDHGHDNDDHGDHGHGGHDSVEHRHTILEHVSFDVAAGSSLAITGPSGSGKSLLLDVMYGLREPTAGVLTLDQLSPTDIRRDVLRRHVALVRDVQIVAGTIAENVHLGRSEIDSVAVRWALRQVGLEQEFAALTEGIETHLTSHGKPLTDGQCRRLALARVLAGHPRLLLIDGLLDGLSDDQLDHVLPNLLKDPHTTVIIVTGRRDIRTRCDQRLDLSGHGPQSSDGQGPSGHGPTPGDSTDWPTFERRSSH
jgi:putative ABC transport system ATP-binding protein